MVCRTNPGAEGLGLFPPALIVEIKSMACELTRDLGVPLSRLSISELQREVTNRGIIAQVSGTTLWRWLSEDAIKPWRYRSWIFPRDPAFSEKAGRVLGLYEGYWDDRPLGPNDYVLSTDEKTSIQARRRMHRSQGPAPHQAMRIEHEYERKGAWAYMAAWDVKRAKIFGCLEEKSGIAPFEKLVNRVMISEPYASANRVFWIMDNGSSHRGPDATITRAEFATMLVKALGLNTIGTTGMFTDVTEDDWYYGAVNAAVRDGLVTGMGDNLFAPNALITREQMAVMVSKALGNKAPATNGTELNAFSDSSSVSSWAVSGMEEAVKAGIVNGMTADTLAPQADATRAQAAVMIYKLLTVLGRYLSV